LDSADALACGNGVPVDNGLRRKRGVDVATGFLPASDVCTVDSGVDEIAGVGVGDKIGVSVAVGVTRASECAVTDADATGVGVVATSAGVGEFPISVGPSAVERTSD